MTAAEARPSAATGGIAALIGQGRIIFGCAALHRLRTPRARRRLVEAAIEAGIRDFDVAPAYGNGLAERLLGELGHGRQDLRIHTKFGIPATIYPAWSDPLFLAARGLDMLIGAHTKAYERRELDPATARTSALASLQRLRRPSLDLLFVHEPLAPFTADAWASLRLALERLKSEGIVREWGIAGPTRQYAPSPTGLADVPAVQQPLAELRVGTACPSASASGAHHVYGVVSQMRAEGRADLDAYLGELGDSMPATKFVLSSSRPERILGWVRKST